jgi:formate hydrogenlyase transcriptional activator
MDELPPEAWRAVGKPRDREERFRKIFEHTNDAVFVVDPERDAILDVNSQACRVLGYSREELLRLPISAIHLEEMPKFLAFAETVVEQGSGWTNDLTCRTKSGERLPSEISASVFELAGRPCVIASVRDVSARKRAEAALQRHSERLEELVAERTAQLTRSEERHRVLLEVNNAIVATRDREPLFEAIAGALRRTLAFDRASLTLHEAVRDILKVYALAGESAAWPHPVGVEIPRAATRLGQALDERRPVRIADLREEPGPEDHRVAEEIRSVLVVPLLAKRGALGTLAIGSREPDFYSDEDAAFLFEVGQQVALAVENMLAYEEITALKARLEQEKMYLQEEIRIEHNFEEIIGQSRVLKRVLQAIETVAPADATVLITGETGTGKELVARAIHHLSPRRDQALIKVNCAALPAGLIESELFGHEKGAFTGALGRKVGRFELADGGTLFLDEVGDLPPELQGKLLRVLQEGEFERLGSPRTLKVDVRIIAATSRDLEAAMREGRFRPDLYYRLHVFPIRMPPLRERTEDIPILVNYFAMQYAKKLGKPIEAVPQAALERLTSYPWPGNVRELENVVERGVILTRGRLLELGEWLRKPEALAGAAPPSTLDEIQRRHILDVLDLAGWQVSGAGGAAKLLGLKPTTLEARMKKLGITRQTGRRPNIS